jgi:hypothetical protein
MACHKIVFSSEPFTAVYPSHYADVGKTLARFSSPIFLPPVFKVVVLLKIELGILGNVGFFVYIHGLPLGEYR